MKKILIILALALTSSLANVDTSPIVPSSKHMDKEKASELTREARTTRSTRQTRKVREARNITTRETIKISSYPLARVSRKIRENRLVTHITRESRKIRHILIQDRLHFAKLK
jgi:hypothetical protein